MDQMRDRATLVATKISDAPVAGLWSVRTVTPAGEQALGNATAAELTKLLLLRAPNDLRVFRSSDKVPA